MFLYSIYNALVFHLEQLRRELIAMFKLER